jgi:hypothetical protein
MRTMMNNWVKFSIAVMTAVSLAGSSFAQDQTDQPVEEESPRAKLVTKKRLNTIAKTQSPVKGFSTVDLFQAMDHGEIKVIIRNKDAADANLIIENKSDKPLAIRMPAAFSCVPVMRQGGAGAPGLGGGGGMGGGGFGGGQGGGGFGGGGGNQGTGGGFGGGQGGGGFGGGGQGGGGFGGGGQGGGGGGFFNIPPGRVGKTSLKTFCLEEGKPDPRSRIEYRIQPLSDLNSDPKIFEMCRMLANDEIAQPVAQAAAWNVANGLSWHQLFVKNRIERMDGSYERYFHPQHLVIAQRVTVASAQRAAARAKWLKDQQKYQSEARYQTGGEASNE